MTYLFKRYIIGLFDVAFADYLLLWWSTVVLRVYSIWPLKHLGARALLWHIKIGLWLQRQWLWYWAMWFDHYLKTDTCWPETQRKMLHNPLCPIGVWSYYKRMLFEMTPNQIASFLVGEPERKAYRERQLRCGFVPQI